MRWFLLFLCTVFFLATAITASVALPPRFQHLTTDDGLPENSIRSILQDHHGFLWFGTHNGLARYDGYGMEVFLPSPQDSGSIFPRFLVALAEDDTGMIWIGSNASGLSRYDRQSDRFTNFRPNPTRPGALPGAQVVDICPAIDGLWLALGDAGLVRFDGISFQREPIRLPDGPSDLDAYPPLSALLVTETQIWVGTERGGLAIRNRGGGNWRLLRMDPADERSLPSDWITDILRDEAGRTWVATRDGLALFRGDDDFEVFQPVAPTGTLQVENYLVTMDADSRGDLWIGSAVGLYHFDPRSGIFKLHAHDPKRSTSPVPGPALSVLVDHSGMVWAGSWHTGLNKYDPWSQKFEVFLHDPDDPDSLDDDAVVSLYEDRAGVLWVGTGSLSSGGTFGGLNRLEPGSEKFTHLPTPSDLGQSVRRFNAIAEDRNGRLWLGSNRGIWRLDDQRSRIVRPPEVDPTIESLRTGSVLSLLLDGFDRLWVATWGNGLLRLDPGTGAWTSYWHDPRDSTSLGSNELSALCLDDRGRVWVGTDQKGLHLYDPESDGFHRFDHAQSGAEAIISIVPATEGRVWVGSSAGVLLVSEENGIEWSFTSHDGLPSDFLGRIQVYDEDKMWISTARGLVHLDRATGEYVVFDRRDGLPSNELYFASVLRSDGTMMFGGHHGMIAFDPRNVIRNPFLPPVVLVNLKVDDQILPVGGDSPLQQSLQLTSEVVLEHDRNNLAISFSSLHFAHPERNQYLFRLIPEDADWRTADRSRTAHYTNLDPGRYQFEVLGSNSDGIWNPDPTVLAITIRPPWWRTHWATAGYLLLIGLVTLGIYRQIVSRERIKAKLEIKRIETRQLQELDRLKSQFFTNISHEVKTPLTLLKAGAQRLWVDSDNPDDELHSMMIRNSDRLGQLIEQLLDLSRLESGQLPVRWQHGNWCAYLRDLVSSHEILATTGEIKLKTKWPLQPTDAWFDPDILEKIAGNLLANALKFTPPGGTIEVVARAERNVMERPVPGFSAEDDESAPLLPASTLDLEVRNTGSYIPPEQLNLIFDRFHQIAGPDGGDGRGTGIGLSLVQELVVWYGGSIVAQSDEQTGTAFRLSIPLFHEAPRTLSAEDLTFIGTDVEDQPTEDDLERETAELGRARACILVVEDHPDLRGFIRRELQAEYDMLEAPDGLIGLDLARNEIPDLVLTDIMMPQLDGYELCRRLKTDERTNHIPVVMLTAKSDSESRLAGFEIGADDYLTKPFDVVELKARITNLLEQRRLLTERLGRWTLDPHRQPEPVESADELFLARAKTVMVANLEDSDFRVEDLCQALAMSRTQLHRKLKAIAGQSTGEFMRTHRLLRAAELLSGHGGNVTEVAYRVGFKSLSHFAKAFREQFGVAPSEYG